MMAVFFLGLSISGCDDDGDSSPMIQADQGMPDPSPDPTPGCDPLMEAACALPWPSNLYLAEDESRSTGYTLTFEANSLPKNVIGDHIDPTPFKLVNILIY